MKKIVKFSSLILLLVAFSATINPNFTNAAEKESYNTEANVGFYGEYPQDPNPETDEPNEGGDQISPSPDDTPSTDTQTFPKLPQTGEKNNLYLIGMGTLLTVVVSLFWLKNRHFLKLKKN